MYVEIRKFVSLVLFIEPIKLFFTYESESSFNYVHNSFEKHTHKKVYLI